MLLSGCATITQGTTQNVQFDSNPRGLVCDILKDNTIYWSKPDGTDEYYKAVYGDTSDDEVNKIWKKGFVVEKMPSDTTILYDSIITPSTLELEKSKFFMIVSCKKDNKRKVISVAPRFN